MYRWRYVILLTLVFSIQEYENKIFMSRQWNSVDKYCPYLWGSLCLTISDPYSFFQQLWRPYFVDETCTRSSWKVQGHHVCMQMCRLFHALLTRSVAQGYSRIAVVTMSSIQSFSVTDQNEIICDLYISRSSDKGQGQKEETKEHLWTMSRQKMSVFWWNARPCCSMVSLATRIIGVQWPRFVANYTGIKPGPVFISICMKK